ncbi:hypothetical protein JT05_09035 [Desulfosporosinus sp. Tol-M]|nr:hypothetical protein JT05_09035 [Desulfosporosinus sp. Tol-M]
MLLKLRDFLWLGKWIGILQNKEITSELKTILAVNNSPMNRTTATDINNTSSETNFGREDYISGMDKKTGFGYRCRS